MSTNAEEICLHFELYPRGAVDQAIEAFKMMGALSVETVAPYHRVRIVPSAGRAADRVLHELANYALAAAAVAGPLEN